MNHTRQDEQHSQAPRNVAATIAGASGGIAGFASVLGSWQICHAVCLAIISVLALIGITITGFPLAFLTTIALPLWSIAIVMLIVLLVLAQRHTCVRKELIMINAGFIVAGTPLQMGSPIQEILWGIGGVTSLAGIILYVRTKLHEKKMGNTP